MEQEKRIARDLSIQEDKKIEEEKFENLHYLYSRLKIPLLFENTLNFWKLGNLSEVKKAGIIFPNGEGELFLNQNLVFSYEDIVNSEEIDPNAEGLNGDYITREINEQIIGYRIGNPDTSLNIKLSYEKDPDQYFVQVDDSVGIPSQSVIKDRLYLYYGNSILKSFRKFFSFDDRYIDDAAEMLHGKVGEIIKDKKERGLLPWQLLENANSRIEIVKALPFKK